MPELAALAAPHLLVTALARGDLEDPLAYATPDELRQALVVAVDRIRVLTGRPPHQPIDCANVDRLLALEHLAGTARRWRDADRSGDQADAERRLTAALDQLDNLERP